MMDYYSQFPAPELDAAKREINAISKAKDLSWAWNDSEYLDKLISEAFIHSNVLDKDNKIKYSFSGWHTFGKNDVINSIDIILEKRRKDKIRRKLRGLLKTTYLLIKAHNCSIERLYHPESSHVNNVLKIEFENNAN